MDLYSEYYSHIMNKQSMKQKIEFIRLKCIEVNPSIKDLVFGCELRAKMWNKKAKLQWKKGVLIENGSERTNPTAFPYIKFDKGTDYGYHEIEIIGRPIRLSDIFVAMKSMNTDQRMAINENGTFMNLSEGSEHWGLCWGSWDLKNDDLEKQSPETIDFLFDLLGGNAK